MKTIYLIRHGSTEWNQEKKYQGSTDLPLSSLGKKQALAASRKFSDIKLDKVYTSSLLRTIQTAEIIFPNYTSQAIQDNRLNELSFGIFEGLTFGDIEVLHQNEFSRWLQDYEKPPQGGEKYSDFAARTADFSNENCSGSDGEDETIAVVAHGGSLREIVLNLLQIPKTIEIYFHFEHCSISHLLSYTGGASVQKMNDSAHLQEL